MRHTADTQLVPVEQVERLIHLARGEKVLLDSDLAMLYGVTTGNLNKAVKRNRQRFPSDFMFQLTDEEAAGLIFQSGISKQRGGRRHNPYAFTEQGVAMLSSVLRSERAVQVNVAIMRAFVGLRRMSGGVLEARIKLSGVCIPEVETGVPSLCSGLRAQGGTLMDTPESRIVRHRAASLQQRNKEKEAKRNQAASPFLLISWPCGPLKAPANF